MNVGRAYLVDKGPECSIIKISVLIMSIISRRVTLAKNLIADSSASMIDDCKALMNITAALPMMKHSKIVNYGLITGNGDESFRSHPLAEVTLIWKATLHMTAD